MKTIFDSDIRITQKFGNDFLYQGKWYYKDHYNIKGHNGLDCVPVDLNSYNIYNTMEGQVVSLEKHSVYGNRIAVWNRKFNLCEYFCHLHYISDNLNLGKFIHKKTFLGKMGNTGASLSAHVHYALAETDKKGIKINKNNGYGGYIDPLPYLEGK